MGQKKAKGDYCCPETFHHPQNAYAHKIDQLITLSPTVMVQQKHSGTLVCHLLHILRPRVQTLAKEIILIVNKKEI